MRIDAEVAIVGGGPVGLATAIGLRAQGIDVLVVDRSRPPIDKACGEGLMPDGVQELERLGIHLAEIEHQPLRGIRYLEEDLVAEASFAGVAGAGVRRTTLHRALVDRAARVGVRMSWGSTVRGLDRDGIITDNGPLSSDWVVGADGLHSRIRKWMSLESSKARWRRNGVRRHYAVAPWTDHVEVYWADDCEAYVTPVAECQVGVAILWSGGKADFESLLGRFPGLQRRLRGATQCSRDSGAGQLEQRTRAFHRGRVALVGDAAGYRDAITGEGLSVGFHMARSLVVAIAAEDLGLYDKAVRRWVALPFFLIRLLLELECRPRLRRRMIRTLAAEPALFGKLLAVHTRDAQPREIGPAGVVRLARGLLS